MKQLTDGMRDAQFEAWWEKSGQFCRSGGGAYEKTFAYTAWLAALDTAQTVQVNAMLVEALEKLQRHDFEMRSKTGDGFAPYVVRIIDDALAATQQAQPEPATEAGTCERGEDYCASKCGTPNVCCDWYVAPVIQQAQPEPDGINDMYLKGYAAGKQAQPERAPLSIQEIADAWGLKPENIPASDIEAVREIEAAHGIGTEK